MTRRKLGWMSLTVAFVAVVSLSAAAQADREADLLRDRGIEPTAEGIAGYLKSLQKGSDDALVKEQIAKLGNDDYKVREAATQKLISMPQLPEAMLKAAVRGKDPEVAMRAQRVLEESHAVSVSAMLDAGFTVIRERQLKGASGAILAAMNVVPPDVTSQALAAVCATAGPEDEKPLRELLKSKDSEIRKQVAGVLVQLLKDKFTSDLRNLMQDADDGVRLFAAGELARQGERACLETLGKMLSCEDPAIRYEAYRLLCGLTGQKIEFVAYDSKESREAAADKWRKWIAIQGKLAMLNHPMKFESVVMGRILVCSMGPESPIIELDENDQQHVLFKVGTNGWGVQRLKNNHVLVVGFGDNTIREYDDKGAIVWKLEGVSAMRALRLDNGNTLVAATDSRAVLEYSPQKKVVWSHTFDKGRVADARRLPNGNTLVALHRADNRVVEIDKNGKEVWELAVSGPQAVQRLDNGNTLVCQCEVDNKVSEYDKTGKEVWTYACEGPLDAMRQPNGNTLISTGGTLIEVDPKGKVVHDYKCPAVARMCR